MMIKKGQTVRLASGEATADGLLGSGAYANVYRLTLPNGSKVALKVFHKDLADALGQDFRNNIDNLIRFGSPSSLFAWPSEAVQLPDGSWGYLMPAAPPGFITLDKALEEGKLNWKTMARFSIVLLGGLQLLHTKQLSFKDISPNNFLVEPETGQALIIDCENITIAGTGTYVKGRNVGHVKGTRGFIAPELLRGEDHSVETDRFASASLLFQMLTSTEPYAGRAYYACPTPQDAQAYLERPVFIFDENDPSNRPGEDEQAALMSWSMIPSEMQNAFRSAFGPSPAQRPDCREWATLLLHWLAEGIGCSCGLLLSRSILAIESGSDHTQCPFCSTRFRLPPVLYIHSRRPCTVSLIPNRPVFRSCVSHGADPFSLAQAGMVCRNPHNPDQLLLVCQQERGWMKNDANGARPVGCHQGVVIRDGLQIAFPHGPIGEIRA